MTIFCVSCQIEMNCKLVSGKDVYPHRKDLEDLNFWQCPECKNFVGCHKNKNNSPLGIIATPELKKARMHIHDLIDPLWKNKTIRRKDLYLMIRKELGWSFHTSMIKSLEEARMIYRLCRNISTQLNNMSPMTDEEFNDGKSILCNYLSCVAGQGVGGNGICFLGGNPRNPYCPKYENEEEAMKCCPE